jgi:hypothetical protein
MQPRDPAFDHPPDLAQAGTAGDAAADDAWGDAALARSRRYLAKS